MAKISDIKGGTPKENAEKMLALLKVQKGPYRDIVIFNSACTLVATGYETIIEIAIKRCEKSIDSGSAYKKLESLISITNSG